MGIVDHIGKRDQRTARVWSSLKDLIAKPLRLEIGGQTLAFESIADLEFCIAPRIGVLPSRLGELLERPPIELKAASLNVRSLELRLSGILEDHDRHGLSCFDEALKLDIQVFSKDYEWRAIFTQLLHTSPKQDVFVRLALAKYLQYLGARQELLRMLFELKNQGSIQECTGSMEGRPFAPDKETVAFATGKSVSLKNDTALRRLPQGKAVLLRLENGGEISIKLAKYKFSLAHSHDWALIADNGKRYVLHGGINSVGRSRDNDVPLDADFSNVSRRHLLAEPVGPDAIFLTDLSSYGTFIPRTAIAS